MRHAPTLRVGLWLAVLLVSAGVGLGVSLGSTYGIFEPMTTAWRSLTFPPSESARGFEDANFKKRKHAEPAFGFRRHPEFRSFLEEALAQGRLVPATEVAHEIRPLTYGDTSLGGEQVLSRYEEPPLTLRSIWSPDAEDAEALLVILPNWRSSAGKVMGFDNTDFHLELGYQARHWGLDVGAIDTVSDVGMAAAINMRLTMLGHQLNGLQAHHICSVVSWRVARKSYPRVVLYGFGMGARLADIVAVMCPQVFDLVVLDGQPTPWKRFIWRQAATSELKEHAIFQYERPLLSDTSFLDFMGHDAVKKVYMLAADDIDRIRPSLEKEFRLETPSPQGSGSILIRRRAKGGLPDIELFRRVVRGEDWPDEAFQLSTRGR